MKSSPTPDARAPMFAVVSAINLACIATDKIADRAAAGADVEGDLADLLAHLKVTYGKAIDAIA